MKKNEFTSRMKAELNNENNVFNEFEIKLYGVQAARRRADQMTTADASTASKMARAAAKVVKSATAAALVVLTFTTSPAAAADQMTTYHTTDTAEAVGVLAQLTAQGLPLYHVTIKKSATR